MVGPVTLREKTRCALRRSLADEDVHADGRRLTEEISWPSRVCGVDLPWEKVTGVFIPEASIVISVDGTSPETSRRVCFLIDLPNAWDAHLFSWSEARVRCGMRAWVAVVSAMVRFVMWHLLQPLLFVWVFVSFYRDLDQVQLVLACCILFREGMYMLLTIVAVVLHPACLLFDPLANVQVRHHIDWRRTMTSSERQSNEFRCMATGAGASVTLVLAPHVFLYNLIYHLQCMVQNRVWMCITHFVCLVLFVGDVCAVGALLVGSIRQDLVLPLIVAYGVSGLGALVVTFDIYGGPVCCGPCLRNVCRRLWHVANIDQEEQASRRRDYPLFHQSVPRGALIATVREMSMHLRSGAPQSGASGTSESQITPSAQGLDAEGGM